MQLSVQTHFRTSVISSGTDFGKTFMDKFITSMKRSCDDDASSAPTPKKCKTRKYDISYLQFGFTVAGTDAEPLKLRRTFFSVGLFQSTQPAGMLWDKCDGISTNGARSMTGRLSGLVNRFQNLAPLAKWTHCMIHCESLASKKMPGCLETVLKQAVPNINSSKARPLNAHLFSLLCQELGAEHEQLLFHTDVRWLSRGRVLHRLYELRSEVMTFLVNVKSDLARYLDDPLWSAQLSYLVDIFDRLNSLNTSM